MGNSLSCGLFACNVGIKDLMFKLSLYVQYFSVIFFVYIYQG